MAPYHCDDCRATFKDADYSINRGNICPYCGSDRITIREDCC